MPLYRVVQPSRVRSRLAVAAGRLTPFVGREVELATLVDRWERAADDEGQNVLLVGEAGNPVVEWRDGKLCWVAPQDIELDEEK